MLNNQGEHGGSICKRTQLQLFVFLFGSRGTAATAGMCFMGSACVLWVISGV